MHEGFTRCAGIVLRAAKGNLQFVVLYTDLNFSCGDFQCGLILKLDQLDRCAVRMH